MISNGEKRYKIKIDDEVQWVERKFLFPAYSDELAIFYEAHLQIK
jgi:hypothetical protein